MEKHHSCINTRAIIDFFKDHCPEKTPALLEGLGSEIDRLPDPQGFLMEVNNWVSSEVVIRMFEKARQLTGDPEIAFKIGLEFVARRKLGYIQRILLFAYKNPRSSLKRAQKINDKFNKNKRLELVHTTRDRAILRLHWFPEIPGSLDFCLYNKGIYSGIPTIWNLPAAEVYEGKCFFRGDECCEYHFKWAKKFSLGDFLRRLIVPWRALTYSIEELERDKDLLKKKFEEIHLLNLQLRQKIDQLECLHETSTAALSVLHLEDLLGAVLKLFKNFAKLDRTGILLLDEEEGLLKFYHAEGVPQHLLNQLQDYRVPLTKTDNILARVMATGMPAFIPDVGRSKLNQNNLLLQWFRPQAVMLAPLTVRGKVIGVLLGDRSSPGATITDGDKEFVVSFAKLMAIALDNALLYQKLRASEQEFRNLVENAHEGIWIVDYQGVIKFFNRRMAEITGFDDLKGRPLKEFFSPDNRRLVEVILARNQIGEVAQEELQLTAKSGRQVSVIMSSVPYQSDGNYLGTFAMFNDISEKKEIETQLRQAQKMEAIGRLAGGIAHDFNNILMAMMGYTEEAQHDLPQQHPVQVKLQQVFKSGQRAADLVRQILTFSRKSEQQRQAVKVTPLLQESLKLLRAALPSTIQMNLNLDNGADTIMADATQIQQVILNLCTNAAHAMRYKGGVLTVSLKELELFSPLPNPCRTLPAGSYLQIIVSDTGHGMDQEVLEHIFEPFFTTKRPGEGTGMGLALVHGIVQNHDGAITVASKPGEGTTFQVFLPHLKVQQPPITPALKAAQPLPRGTERILLVDDEAPLVEIGERLLKRLGYDVVAKTDSLEALQVFQEQPGAFDLVITDQTMPNLMGVELAKKLLNLRADIPIILCTGFSEALTPEQARAMGIRKILLKPVGVQEMGCCIREILDNPATLEDEGIPAVHPVGGIH